MKKLKNISLTLLIALGAFLSAYASASPDPDDVNCKTPSKMFGSSSCTDEYGSVKFVNIHFGLDILVLPLTEMKNNLFNNSES